MSRFALAALAMASTVASAPVAAQPALAPYAAVFKADRGLSVVVAPTADDKSALVRLQGINHPADGVVFQTDRIDEGKRLSFRTTLDGRPWTLVISEDFQSWGGSYNRTQAYVPGTRDGVALQYDEKASKALDLKALAQTYEKQRAEGVQDRLARFDRDKAIANAETRLKSEDEAASSACATSVRTTVDWDSVSEDQMKRLSIGGYCSPAASAMRRLCEGDEAFKAQAARHASITCRFGDRLNLSRQDGRTVFTTAESAPNQDDFAFQYLRNQ